jgi:hypothetical protein
MGFFSWKTSNTNKSISNAYSNRGALEVYLITPKNEAILETNYEGYGVFGGHDAYALLARWNRPELCNGNDDHDRRFGIELAFSGQEINYPLKFVEKLNNSQSLDYMAYEASEDCPHQGFFYNDEDEERRMNNF